MIEKKIIWKWDNCQITNVPVMVDEFGEQFFKGSVSYKISAIAEYMGANNLTEYDFNDFVLDINEEE